MSAPTTPFGTPFGTGDGFAHSVDVGVSWTDIRYTVPDGNKGSRDVLKGLTGNALPRRALAIMGSSGAGKTTFLNALSDRLESDGKTLTLSGSRYLNDVEYERRFRNMIGYVTQEDVLDPMSTPTEILNFSLRVRRGLSSEESEGHVDKMIEELGLEKARDTIVGIPPMVVGLSGGERKRANIGSELITQPKVLYLDEPTSGLDSVTAARICQLMKKLATRGRTVVYTIHQPTAECVEYFDDLMLMCQGHVVFHGPFEDAVDYFAGIGYPCPETHTPTDFFMTLLQDEQIGGIIIEKWQEFLEAKGRTEYPYTAPILAAEDSKTYQYLKDYSGSIRSSTVIEAQELFKRALKTVARNRLLVTATFIQNVFFGLIVGLLFVKLEDNVAGVSDRMGLLFIVVVNLGFSGVMGVLNNFPHRKAVFIREQQAGAYSPFLFFVTMSLAELPLQLFALFLQDLLVYWIAGLAPTASAFFTYYAATAMVQQVGVGYGYLIGTAIDSYVVASGFAPLVVIPQMIVAGLLMSTDRIRPYWYWVEKPSFLRAAFLLVAQNEFEELDHLRCDVAEYGASFCARQPSNGNEVLTNFKFNDDHSKKWIQWMILAILFFLIRFFVVLSLNKVAKRKQ